jgi:oxygen-independent coproporphyrinogen-3 oxidase
MLLYKELYKERFEQFDSIYLGGGTPAMLSERDLAVLFACLSKHFTISTDSEITIEANPDGLTKEKLKAIKDLGINRISLGVQSLDDKDLQYLGRRHNSAQALEALEMIHSAGFSNVSVDLMYGLETQDLLAWKRTVSRILEFGPEHMSCYQLTIEKGTPFGKMREAGNVRPIGEKLQTAFFIWTSRFLEKNGYSHYEISNFARKEAKTVSRRGPGPKALPGQAKECAEKTGSKSQGAKDSDLRCRHNLKYWSHVPYLGLGPSAHSFQAGSRWWNVRSVRKYCELLAEGKAPVEASEVLSEEQLDLESLALGFRTSDGASLQALGDGLRSTEVVEELEKLGLVKVKDSSIKPTRRGFLVADSLPLMFDV